MPRTFAENVPWPEALDRRVEALTPERWRRLRARRAPIEAEIPLATILADATAQATSDTASPSPDGTSAEVG